VAGRIRDEDIAAVREKSPVDEVITEFQVCHRDLEVRRLLQQAGDRTCRFAIVNLNRKGIHFCGLSLASPYMQRIGRVVVDKRDADTETVRKGDATQSKE